MTDPQRRRDLDRAVSDWSWEADEELRITRLCDRFAGATGRPASPLLGQPVDLLGDLSADLLGALERRGPLRDESLIVDPQGKAIGFRLSGEPLFGADGAFRGYSGIAIRGEAESATDSRAAFLSNVGHEFRTPLNAIIGFAEVMNGELFGPLSDRYAGYARDIAQAGRHLLALIEDVLDAAAGERETAMTLEPTPVDAIIDRALRIAAISANTRRVSIIRDDAGQSLMVQADGRRACQILVNLLVNAIKFSAEGSGVTIAARAADNDIEIEVADQGPGIAPEDQTRIFDKFEQASPFAQPEGAGLGLAIARDLAEAMGGSLGVASVPGEGARFTLRLPAAAASIPQQRPSATAR